MAVAKDSDSYYRCIGRKADVTGSPGMEGDMCGLASNRLISVR
jgi:hypothetical protein